MNDAEKTLISFVIPAHNEEKYIGDCLQSIRTYTGGRDDVEIIVVNNNSDDNTVNIARAIEGVRVVDEPEKGLTRARQRGLMSARGEFVAYLDADTRLSAVWMPVFTKAFTENKNLVCLSGPPSYYDLPPFQKFIAELGWKIFAPTSYRLVGYMVWGGNFVAKKEKLLAIGGFDANIVFHGEDTDIARRLDHTGKVAFRTDFVVFTSGRRLLEEGLLTSYLVYGLNFLWQVVFHKPFTSHYKDVR